jgi:hypothetical protein
VVNASGVVHLVPFYAIDDVANKGMLKLQEKENKEERRK